MKRNRFTKAFRQNNRKKERKEGKRKISRGFTRSLANFP
jgi:hypothetical protein